MVRLIWYHNLGYPINGENYTYERHLCYLQIVDMTDSRSSSGQRNPTRGRPHIRGMPKWFKQYLRTIEQIPIPAAAPVASVAPPVDAAPRPVDFPKLHKVFLNIGGKTYSETEGYSKVKAWISN